jgi:hypothetical protein
MGGVAEKVLGQLDGLGRRMGTSGEHLVRQGDGRRREDFVRHAYRELTNFVRITPVNGPKKLGPRWCTLRMGLPTILCNYAERDTSLELATFGLGSLGDTVHQSAPECTKPDFAADGAVQGAPECTIGADSGARSKDGGVPAVRIEEAMKALAVGDIETARRLLG